MSEYLTALSEETRAWKTMQELLLSQRMAIIQRRGEVIWELQDQLHEAIHTAARCVAHSRTVRPIDVSPEERAAELETKRVQEEAGQSLRLNHELLNDMCTYLQMLREVIAPRAVDTYTPPRQRSGENNQEIITGSRIA